MIISLGFAFVLGFSAHRAGVCTVSAVNEVMTSKSARMFASFLKVVLWVLLVNVIALWWWPDLVKESAQYQLTPFVFAGGFVFGVGAGINGGCSFSTVSKIAQGDIHVALTLPAFIAGAYIFVTFTGDIKIFHVIPDQTKPTELHNYIVIGLLVWACYELIKVIRPFVTKKVSYKSLFARRYRLSSGAALIGICSGLLYLIHGRWAYSSGVLDYFVPSSSRTPLDGTIAVCLFLALLSGAITSAVINKQLNFTFARDKWHRNIAGGLLMGAGASMIPGGNGKLILHDMPDLAVNAFFAYLFMIIGIAITLLLQKKIYGTIQIVSCGGDVCTVEKAAEK
jgi:uncharacterized membrane protein YedE/YeeE